jgi:hypothetical protein
MIYYILGGAFLKGSNNLIIVEGKLRGIFPYPKVLFRSGEKGILPFYRLKLLPSKKFPLVLKVVSSKN